MLLVLAAALVMLLAVPASAAAGEVNPKLLVLQQTDVPANFRFVASQSGVRSNARRTRDYPPALRPDLARFGRLTGYQALYVQGPQATMITGADLFRRATGAKALIRWSLQQAAKQNPRPKATAISIGDQGWVFTTSFASGSTRSRVVTVNWRQRRVLATVVGIGLSRETVIILARTQQRRIAAALG